MAKGKKNTSAGTVTRRDALLRLGFGAVAAYSAPAFLTLSEARASGSKASNSSGASGASSPSGPSDGTGTGSGRADAKSEVDLDLCSNPASGSGGASISKRDSRRAQKAVARGRALPLRDVFDSVQREIGGRVLEVRFTDSKRQAIYDLRMISGNGNLVAVRVQAATGKILKVAGC